MFVAAVTLAALGVWMDAPRAQSAPVRVRVQLPSPASPPLDGRLLVILAKDGGREPRFQVSDGPGGQQVFGIDVENWSGAAPLTVDSSALGFPLERLSDVPAGTYTAQALLHKYETFKRADGFTVKMPMDRGEGQQWAQAPGNLYSTPAQVRVDPNAGEITLTLDKEIPPIPPPTDTKYIKHERIQSTLLTKFWGRPMHLGANVLLPEGWDTHPTWNNE